jgi:hypothetical protein
LFHPVSSHKNQWNLIASVTITKKAEGRGQEAEGIRKSSAFTFFVNAHPCQGIKEEKIFSLRTSSLEEKRRPYFNPFFFRGRVS